MHIFEKEKPIAAPLVEPHIDTLLSGWNSTAWGETTSETSCNAPPRSLRRLQDSEKQSSSDDEPSKVRTPCHWVYKDDCELVDIFTSVCPEKQKLEVRKRLPNRRLSDAFRRFQQLCGEMKEDEPVHKPSWKETGKKQKCVVSKSISKSLAKFR